MLPTPTRRSVRFFRCAAQILPITHLVFRTRPLARCLVGVLPLRVPVGVLARRWLDSLVVLFAAVADARLRVSLAWLFFLFYAEPVFLSVGQTF